MAAVRSNEAAGALEVSRLDRGGQALDAASLIADAQRKMEQAPQERGIGERATRFATSMTPIGAAQRIYEGDFGAFSPASMLGNEAQATIGGQVLDKTRMAAGLVGGDESFTRFLTMFSGSQAKASAASDKLDAAADKLAKAAEAIEAKAAPVRTRTDLTGPARREAAEVAR